jgi:hypothetical protein
MASTKADYVLADGREIVFDLDKLSMREYRAYCKGSLLNDDDDQVLGRVTGLPAETFGDLPQPEYRRVVTAFLAKAREPLADPS